MRRKVAGMVAPWVYLVLAAWPTGSEGTQEQEMAERWAAYMEYQGVATGLQWKTTGGAKAEEPQPCLGVCRCTGEHADCRRQGLQEVPLNSGSRRITSLDLSGNKLHSHSLASGSMANYTHIKELFLKDNQLQEVPKGVFELGELRILQLGGNNISQLGGLGSLASLTNLGLESNRIDSLDPGVFRENTQLTILNLGYNLLPSFPADVFQGLDRLQILELNNNYLTELPPALASLKALERVSLAKNRIENIPPGILQGLRKLQQLEVGGNPVHTIHHNAFVHLPSLRKLQILGSPRVRNVFPNLTGTPNLHFIHLDRLRIESVPDDLCHKAPALKTLRLRSNSLTSLPVLAGCRLLNQLDMGHNRIEALPELHLKQQGMLADLLLDRNDIKTLGQNSFLGLNKLQILNMDKNNISEIHEDAFLPLNNIKDLNLGNNGFSTLPHKGLKTLVELKAHNNPALKDFPNAESFPHIRIVRPSYAYHCCQFLPSTYDHMVEYADFGDLKEDIFFPGEFDMSQFGNQSMPSVIWSNTGNTSASLGEDLSMDLWENFVSGMAKGYPDMANYDETAVSYFRPPEGIDCYPAPGPFLPCNDLFDWWTLRCGVWIVFLLALLGNGCVVFVLSCSRNRIDVPRFLVCNLAMADFFMGLYLGFLAVLDASTLGEFRKYAIQWQLSAACEIAGFFGVLSSELSVFTLAVITMERNYAITHAMHLNKRLSLKHAAYIMIGAWSFSILMASLPLFGVSDYRKFAVCLPFETEGALSRGYVIFLMIINGVAFFILMGCYLKMYCAIRGSQAWNSNDSRIAKRMALLVFTDFICWFPIAFFALTAAGGAHLISLEAAKVFTVFVLPLNSCCNPFLYAILTKQFKKDCVMICKAIEESRVTRGIGRCRHSSNFSNRQTPANTNSINSGSGSGSHTRNNANNGVHCSCTTKKPNKISPRWPLNKLKALLCGFKDMEGELNSQNEWNYQIAEIQHKQQKTKRHASEASSDNFSSSRSDSWNKAHCIPLRFVDHHRRRNSWTVTRKASQDSNMSSSRNDSQGSNSTQSTNTWRMSRTSQDFNNSIARTGSGYSDKFSALTQAKVLRAGSGHRSPLSLKKQNSSGQLVSHGGHAAIMVRGKPKLIRQVAVEADGQLTKQVSFREPSEPSCPIHAEMAQAAGTRPTIAQRYRTLYAKLTESSHEDEESDEKGAAGGRPIPQPSPLVVGTTTVPRLLPANPALNLVNSTGESAPLTSPSSPRMPTLLSEREIKQLSMENLRHPRSVDCQRRVSLGQCQAPPTQLGETLLSRQSRHHASESNLAEPKYGPGRCTSENALVALQSKYGYSFKSAAQGSGVVMSRSDNLLHTKLEGAAEGEDNGGVEESRRLLEPSSDSVSPPSTSPPTAVIRPRTLLSPEPPSLPSLPARGRTPTIEEQEEPGEADQLL